MSEGRSGGYTETRAIHCRPGMVFEFHPLADVFPTMGDDEFQALVKDVRERGLLEPVALYEGRVLDGRHRVRACQAAGMDVEYHNLGEDIDPVRYVVGANLHRRHLSPTQKAAVAAELSTTTHGGDRSKSPIGDLKVKDAALLTGASKRSTERARDVKEKAPELFKEMLADNVTAGGAEAIVKRIEAAALEDSEAARTEPPGSEIPGMPPPPPITVKVACSLEGEFEARDAASARREAVLALSERLKEAAEKGSAKAMKETAAEAGVSLDVTVPKEKRG